MPSRENVYSSPVLPLDWPWAEGDDVWPCSDCLPWHVEFFPNGYEGDPEGLPWVREWHAVGCHVFEDHESS